ncbi:MAG: geranylgeranylglyceryl/heptaprenylglyceryl phosphate synthase [Thermoplasmata archaeon]
MRKIQKVLSFITRRLKKGRIHMTLIDPEKQGYDKSKEIALLARKAGTDAIMVGGSTVIDINMLEETLNAVREVFQGPVILFPASSHTLSSKADAIYFMSLLNSRLRQFLVEEQLNAVKQIREIGIEVISMGYVVLKPGMTVGEVGEADLLGEGDEEKIASYALLTKFFGMKLFYLESGSGAPYHAPAGLIKSARAAVDIPILVGGGIKTPQDAAEILEAGADVIVTGSIIEMESKDRFENMRNIIERVHEFGPAVQGRR